MCTWEVDVFCLGPNKEWRLKSIGSLGVGINNCGGDPGDQDSWPGREHPPRLHVACLDTF